VSLADLTLPYVRFPQAAVKWYRLDFVTFNSNLGVFSYVKVRNANRIGIAEKISPVVSFDAALLAYTPLEARARHRVFVLSLTSHPSSLTSSLFPIILSLFPLPVPSSLFPLPSSLVSLISHQFFNQ
jgi:hypothetical protein